MERPIVCGTDLSPVAAEAADVAAALARRLETSLILIHVEQFYGMAEVDPSLFEAALSGKRTAVEGEADRLLQLGTKVETQVLAGSIFDEIVTSVIQANARTLVVGAVGRSLSQRLLLGSVAERTAENSPVPTLVVRPGSAFVSWLRGERILKVLVGYDFSATSDAALAWVGELHAIGQCEITIVHVSAKPDESDETLEQELSRRVGRLLPVDQVHLAIRSSWGSPEGALFEASQADPPDLIVVGTYQRHGLVRLRFGSVSRAVLRHAKVSVAVVPPAAAQSGDGKS
jgi:nucleotide-binding universal stress UspA family protein